MKLKAFVMDRAFCRPRGLLGRVGGQLMSRDTELPASILDILDLQPSESLLEIGSGPGLGLALAADKVPEGRAVGLDASDTMLAMAQQRNQAQIESGRIELHLGSVEHLPFAAATFDAAMTINCLHLWQDPADGLAKVRKVLRPSGRMAVAISRFSNASSEKFESQMLQAGFTNVSVHHAHWGTCVIGHNSRATA